MQTPFCLIHIIRALLAGGARTLTRKPKRIVRRKAMPVSVETAAPSKARLWTGRILTVLTTLFLLFDGVMKLGSAAARNAGNDAAWVSITPLRTHWHHSADLHRPLRFPVYLCLWRSASHGVSWWRGLCLSCASVLRCFSTRSSLSISPYSCGLAVYLQEPRLRTLIPVRT